MWDSFIFLVNFDLFLVVCPNDNVWNANCLLKTKYRKNLFEYHV